MIFACLSCVYGDLIIPQRYVTMVMLHLGICHSFIVRFVLETVISELTPSSNYTVHDYCPEYTFQVSGKSKLELPMPEWAMRMVSHSFYMGYTLGQIPAGYVSDKWGCKHVLGFSMLISGVLVILIPKAIENGRDYAVLWLRGTLGLFQAPTYPAVASFQNRWALRSELSFIGGVSYSGPGLGIFLSEYFTGHILRGMNSWSAPFYIWGSLALTWCLFYTCIVFSSPLTHPFITEEELEHFENEIERKKDFSVPWCEIFSSTPVWALFVKSFTANYTSFSMVAIFPEYMRDILKWDITGNAGLLASPLLLFWAVSVMSSWFAGHMIDKKWMTISGVRKLYGAISGTLPGLCMLIMVYLRCNREGAFAMYAIGWFCKGFEFSCLYVNVNDLTHNYGGILMGMLNGTTAPTGILGHFLMTHFIVTGDALEWQQLIWVLFGISVFCTMIFVFFLKADRQSWDFPPDADTDSL